MATAEYVSRLVCGILWKSWRSRRHHWIRTFIEIIAPVILALLLVTIKAVIESNTILVTTTMEKPTTYPPHDMKGLLSHLCNGDCRSTTTKGVLAYAPSDSLFLERLMEKVKFGLTNRGHFIDILGFQSEMEVEGFNRRLELQKLNSTDTVTFVGGVIFPSELAVDPENHLAYKLRFVDPNFVTGRYFPEKEEPGPGIQFKEYETTGFLGLQLLIDSSYIELLHYNKPIPYSVEVQAFPYPPYQQPDKINYSTVISKMIPATIVIGFGLMLTLAVAEITKESETGIKNLLTMVGVNNSGYWIGWYLDMFIISTISVCSIVPILTMNITGGEGGAALVHSSSSLMWFIMFFFAQSSIWFCFFVSLFIKSSEHAKALGYLLWIASLIIPALLIGTKQSYLGTQLLFATLPAMNLYWSFGTIANWESNGIGAHWGNTFDFPNHADSLSLSILLSIQVLTTIFYMVMTLMISDATEEEWKLKGPIRLYNDAYENSWLLDSIRYFWRGCCNKYSRLSLREFWIKNYYFDNDFKLLRGESEKLTALKSAHLKKLRKIIFRILGLVDGKGKLNSIHDNSTIQEVRSSLRPELVMKNISKSFNGVPVLKAFSCTCYSNEITAFVGKSGSGKTTLINLITGILKMDLGHIYVNDYDVHEYLTEARRSIGVCPQTTMLFDELTVAEHIYMFSWLKGNNRSEALKEIKRLISAFGLKGYSATAVRNLSEEQKRRLSFVIAICGDSKIILLDEPTANIDIESKKIITNALMDLKKENKTVVFTTKSLEDGFLFANRIGLLSEGRLQCFGKARYLQSQFQSVINVTFNVRFGAAETILKRMEMHFPNLEIRNRKPGVTAVGGEEITCSILEEDIEVFPLAFENMQELKDSLLINNMSVSRQTVEEYFDRYNDKNPFIYSKNEEKSDEPDSATLPDCITDEFILNMRKRKAFLKMVRSEGYVMPNLEKDELKSYFRKEVLTWLASLRRDKNVVKHTRFKWSKETEEKVFSLPDKEEQSKPEGCKLLLQRKIALLKKLYLITKTSVPLLLFQIVFPVLLLMSGISIANRGFRNQDDEHYSEININLQGYEQPITHVKVNDRNLDKYFANAIKNENPVNVDNVEDAVYSVGKHDIQSYRKKYPVGIKQEGNVITALFSTGPYNAAPLAINIASNILLNLMDSSVAREISVSNHPINGEALNPMLSVGKYGQSTIVTSLIFYLSCALAVICVCIAVKPKKERRSGSHHIQIMTGMNPWTFWTSYFIFDGLYIFIFSSVSIIMILILEDKHLFSSHYGLGTMWFLLMCSGFMCLSCTYYICQITKRSIAVFSWFTMFQLSAGLGGYFVYKSHDGVSDGLTVLFYWFTCPFPIPLMVHALYCYSKILILNSPCNLLDGVALKTLCSSKSEIVKTLASYSCCDECANGHCFQPSPFLTTSIGLEEYTIERDIYLMLTFTLLYSIMLLMHDLFCFKVIYRFFMGAPSEEFAKDERVMESTANMERLYIQQELASDSAIKGFILDDVCKNYGANPALTHVSFGIQRGECLGLVDVEGSGKTALLKIITGEEIPTLGDVYLEQFNLLDERMSYMSIIGYSPIENGLLEDLTCQEHVELFSKIHGSSMVDDHLCAQYLISLGLADLTAIPIKYMTKSKKKLVSVALALIGGPKLLIVDEPSAGVDAADCQALWDTLQAYRDSDNPVLIMSTNLDECQILCNRVGLFAGGILNNISESGRVNTTKGLVLTLYLDRYYYHDETEDIEIILKIRELLAINFDFAVFKEQNENLMKFVISGDEDWREIFICIFFIVTFMDDLVHSFTLSECPFSEGLSVLKEKIDLIDESKDTLQLNCFQNFVINCTTLKFCKDDEFA